MVSKQHLSRYKRKWCSTLNRCPGQEIRNSQSRRESFPLQISDRLLQEETDEVGGHQRFTYEHGAPPVPSLKQPSGPGWVHWRIPQGKDRDQNLPDKGVSNRAIQLVRRGASAQDERRREDAVARWKHRWRWRHIRGYRRRGARGVSDANAEFSAELSCSINEWSRYQKLWVGGGRQG